MKAMLKGTVIAALVGGCCYVYAQWDQLTVWPSKRAPMLKSLKDPESARLESERLQGRYLCGTVNAKNSYGAYVGAARFVSFEDGYAINGGLLNSWPSDHAPTNAVFEAMETKVKRMRSSDTQVDMNEEHRLAFEDLWSRTCGAKAIAASKPD